MNPSPEPNANTGARVVDVEHLGRPHVIGAWVVDEQILVDPGPAVSIPRLLERLGDWRPRAIALTHIHLDHAGGTGTLLRHWPDTEVWVDERGAPHLARPERLLRSAERIYGEEMGRLWGETEAVPEDAIRIVRDGERHGPFEVIYTPGHASHHVCYLHDASRTAYVGDMAGIRVEPEAPVLPPTVPPEFDPERWRSSLERIREWRPRHLAITHFGRHDDVEEHLAATDAALGDLLETNGDLDAVTDWLSARLASRADEIAAATKQAADPAMLASGIARYCSRED